MQRCVDTGGLAAVATLVLYIWIAPTHVVDGDNAEFATLGAQGGVAHPSGYPLYLLLLRATSWLPAVSAAHRAAIATAVIGALAVLVLHAACRAWGARPLAATFTVFVLAASPTMLRVSTEAEVFALNVLVVALVLWLGAQRGPVRGMTRAVLLGLVAGLGMSNHLTCTLLAPVGLLGVARATRESSRPTFAVVAATIGAWIVGLTPYAYLFVAPDTAMSWRRIDTLPDLVYHVLRMDYGGPGAFAPSRSPIGAVDNLAALGSMLGRTWLYVLLPVGALGVGARALRHSDRAEPRAGWIALATSFAVAGPLLVTRFNVPLDGVGIAVCQRFYLLPAVLLAIPIAFVLGRIGVELSHRTRAPSLGAPWIASILALAAFAAIASQSLPRHSAAIECGARNLLAPLPERAVVIVSADYLYFSAIYVQQVLGERRDVAVLASGQLLNPEYRKRVHERHGVVELTPGDKLPSLAIARDTLARGRSMFIDPPQFNIRRVYPVFPFGLLFRVLPQGEAVPQPSEVLALNKAIYEKLVFGYAKPGSDDDYATSMQARYAQIWRFIANALAGVRDLEGAAFADETARRLAPGHPW